MNTSIFDESNGNKSSTWLKITTTAGAKVFSLAASLITLVLTARWLGPEGRGIIAAALTWVGLFSVLGHMSLGQVAIHQAVGRETKDWLPRALGSLMLITAFMSITGWLLAATIHYFTQGRVFAHIDTSTLIIAFVLLPVLIWEQYGSSLLMGTDLLRIYNKAQLIGRGTGVILVILALHFGTGIKGVLIATLIAQGYVAFSGTRLLLSLAGPRIRPRWSTTRHLLIGGLKLHPNAVGMYLTSSASVLIINQYVGHESTGHYHLAVQLLSLILVLPQATAMLFYTQVTQVGPNQAWAQQKPVIKKVLMLTVGVAACAGVLAPLVIPLVVGSRFTSTITIFQSLLPVLIGMSLGALLAPQTIGRGMFKDAALITLVTCSINLISSSILIPSFGINGAIWAMILTYSISALAGVYYYFVFDKLSNTLLKPKQSTV